MLAHGFVLYPLVNDSERACSKSEGKDLNSDFIRLLPGQESPSFAGSWLIKSRE